MKPAADVWVHPNLAVGPSPIEGTGLFTTEPISAGTLVIRLGGRLVSTAELNDLIASADADPDAAYVDSTTVDDDAHLVLPPRTLAHYANHSCDPNLWLDGPYEVVARRHIPTGEELSIDYGTITGAPGFRMTCSCGSPACRGEVSSDDFTIIELQDRYRGHWVPALERRINRGR